MEALGRGLVAVPASDKTLAVSWRLLATDADDIAFHVYRAVGKAVPKRLTDKPLTDRTHFLDTVADLSQPSSYFVCPVVKGTEGDPCPKFTVSANAPKGYLSIPLKTLPGHTPNDASVGDLDGNGEFDIIYGACCVGSDGKGRYSTGLGHGDALHVSDLDPSRAGLEVFNIHEKSAKKLGVSFRDAKTGEVLWSKESADVGRGVCLDIDPRYTGCESWASGDGLSGVWTAKGEQASKDKPRSCNFAIWWDGDPLRELLDRNRITKWDWKKETETPLLTADGCSSNNGTKSTPALCADILGDWRDEVILRTTDNKELRISTTPEPTEMRLVTLCHDPQYRLAVAWQNVGYNQPPHPGYYLGDGMKPPPRARIKVR